MRIPTIRIKIKENKKAVVKFRSPNDLEYFKRMILNVRDDGGDKRGIHPVISIRGTDNKELPPLQPPKKIEMPQNLTPELRKKMGLKTIPATPPFADTTKKQTEEKDAGKTNQPGPEKKS